MFKKSFVSLVFSSQKIQILQLDSSKKKIKSFGSFPLPKGTIINRQIKNLPLLTQTISTAWKQLKLKEKSVGIVIPEFSTFTKSIKLPKLSPSELDEAVRWQSKDFLLDLSHDMVLDWEVVKEEDGEFQILVVAMQKDALTHYVDATSRAGLYPLVVETPSLSLTRISDGDDKGRLIIYVNQDETILVISQGETIIASSVATSSSQNEIIKTAIRMLNHYKNIPVYRIVVGGIGISREFLKNVQTYTQRPAEMASVKVEGLNPGQIQEYLIPLSLQLKNPAQPKDAATINLLPTAWAKHYQSKKNLQNYWSITLLTSFATWGIFLVTFAVFLIFGQKVNSLKKQISQDSSLLDSKVIERIDEVNSLSKSVLTINAVTLSPQSVINQIASKKPPGISINLYDLNLEKGELIIKGNSSNRSSLLVFKDSLQKIEGIMGVELPITNFINEENIDFNIKLITKKEEKKTPKLKI